MTAERLLHMLDEPERLASISYEELKTLSLAYPYAHNLRQLLLLKSKQTAHPEEAENLASAAAHSLDRRRLYALCIPAMLVAEPILELRPLEEMQHLFDIKVPVEAPAEKQSAEAPIPTPTETPIVQVNPMPSGTEEILIPAPIVNFPAATQSEPAPATQPFGLWVTQFNLPILRAPERTVPAEPYSARFVAAPPVPVPVQHDEEPEDLAAEAPKKGNTSPRQPSIAQALAEQSVAEKEEVMSETLAKIYAMQGHKEKAILMYERLSLAFPEKSTFFAALIAQLKK